MLAFAASSRMGHSVFIVEDGFLPEEFPERLAALKWAADICWDVFAACLGVDRLQFQRWRKGTRPSGDGLLLAREARIPIRIEATAEEIEVVEWCPGPGRRMIPHPRG